MGLGIKLGLIGVLVVASFYFAANAYLDGAYDYLAGAFFSERVTPEGLLSKYKNGEIKILIVPGHDKDNYGTQYRGVTEASLNAELGNQLFEHFRGDRKFTAFITHNSAGELNDWISDYVKTQDTAINRFKDTVKSVFKNAVKIGAVKKETKVFHNPAADNTSKILYGINKWANDNGADIVLHLHFNDYPGRAYDLPGKYSGFAIYIPDDQLPNYRASSEIAKSIRQELKKNQTESNFPKEKDIIIEDQQLIAVGSNASRDGVSLLLEYGYIYESEFANKAERARALRQLAEQTYAGVKNFFEK